jgi:hypothetical protein
VDKKRITSMDRIREQIQRYYFRRQIDWSGDNNAFARALGGVELSKHLDQLKSQFPVAKHFVVAHSHGGNVALYGAQRTHVDGIACLATPFLHVSLRDSAFLNGKAIQRALAGLVFFVSYLMYLTVHPKWLEWFMNSSWITWLGFAFCVVMLSAVVAGVLSSFIDIAIRTAPRFAETFTARVPRRSEFCAFRVIGDEASLVLAAGQLISWSSAKMYSYFSGMKETRFMTQPLRGINFSNKWWWVIGLLVFCVLVGNVLAHFGVVPVEQVTFYFTITLCALLLILALLYTTLWDSWLLGLGLVLLSVSSGLMMLLTGTIPPAALPHEAENDGAPPRLVRWLLGFGYAMVADIHTEATPPGGPWAVYQFEKNNPIDYSQSELAHSIYSHPYVRKELINWLGEMMRKLAPCDARS